MSAGYRLKPHVVILIINAAAIIWLFAKTQAVDVTGHFEKLSEINELKTLSLALDRSIFELNVAWLNNYDPIVDSQKHRDRILDHLYEHAQGVEKRGRLENLFDGIHLSVQKRDKIAERIKSVHSQIKSSEFYFPILIKKIISYQDSLSGSFRERSSLLRLGRLVSIYRSSLAKQARQDIDGQLKTIEDLFRRRIASDPSLGDLLGSAIEHARIIVTQAGRFETLSQDFLTLDYHDALAEIYEIFSAHFAKEQYFSQSLFHLLYAILLFLIVHIAFLFFLLVSANRKVQDKADDLEVSLEREKQVNGLQRQFVSMVSHEFRTPLAIIDGSAQRLQRSASKADPERLEAISGKIRLSVRRLIDLMESVLSVARLEEGKIQFDQVEMDLQVLVAEVVDNYRDLNSDRKISLDVDDLPTRYLGDPKLLRQVISNLLSNAVKYSAGGSPIHVEAKSDEETIAVGVRDHGVGIPADEIEKISERFFRASSSTGIAGSGIGLHLVQYILTLHGGRLEVQSVLGEGSCFTAHLAMKSVSPEESAEVGTTGDIVPLHQVDPLLAKAG